MSLKLQIVGRMHTSFLNYLEEMQQIEQISESVSPVWQQLNTAITCKED